MSIISAVQFKPRMAFCSADVSDNFKKCEDLIHQAWNLGSELVVFPELFLTGYSFLSAEEAILVSEPWDGRTFKTMRSVANSLKAYIAWGYVEIDGDRLYNSATIVAPNGVVVCRYRKNNLWGNDFLWASPGRERPHVVDTELGKISVIVCRDLRDKIPTNLPRQASEGKSFFSESQSPDIVAACVNWGDGGFPSTKWMDFAADNKCNLVIANRWGEENSNNGFKQDFGKGGSIIIEPDWTTHTSGLKFNNNCVVTAVINSKVIR